LYLPYAKSATQQLLLLSLHEVYFAEKESLLQCLHEHGVTLTWFDDFETASKYSLEVFIPGIIFAQKSKFTILAHL